MKTDMQLNKKTYSLSGFEGMLNSVVQWLFFYRMIWIATFVLIMAVLLLFSWPAWSSSERLGNATSVLTCGSIVIMIMYTVVNHEVDHFRKKKERLMEKKRASFDVVSEWHRDGIVQHLRINRKMYEEYKHLIDESKSREFSELLDSNEEARFSLVTLFNYLECIALGVTQQIHDEEFMRNSFRGIFIAYLNDYDFFIQYRRKKLNNERIWKEFTDLATRWRNTA
ncbi:MAG: hypothetical protein ABS85_07190 [Sphingobacteriales bacterium SCN 48-20]|uniref:DUF4760 domain-containing protein n=1 Tax=Terrimonas ferruginea TaxID=249 RepID=UPI00086C2F44|nr:DUF4760 domain-containing protein [Terrimonas ferruginea]MBN8782403.1 DUF4760 domain-containing protein [Terrimonas ferruginea]ODT93046.1 MAG: hypothetical protein ABS85_07190 [Sphingobacteriales bacterium SCN 48-20]OJW42916.1 MAG: hypothetical protein BGO56_12865 [Sphingobacteriales bacterium 48-107]